MQTVLPGAEPRNATRTRSRFLPTLSLAQVGFAVLLLAWFVRFVAPGLEARFNIDDPMNIYHYWSKGGWELVRNLFLFFTTYGRPMGGAYFYLLYSCFGLNPLPYHIVITALLLLNTWLSYRFGRLLLGSQLAGALVALVMIYHAGMAHVVFLPAFVFDVLCFTFYVAAFTYYLSIRTRGLPLTPLRIAVFLLLYIGALEAKEMAVSLPVMVLLHELIWHPPAELRVPAVLRWMRREALPALIAGLITVVYLLGKTFGRETLVQIPAYRPEFTWHRYFETTTSYLNIILYQGYGKGFVHAFAVILFAALLLWIAVKLRSKPLLLMWFFVWIVPLPITFIHGRSGGSLYLPLAGWAVFLVVLFLAACERLVRLRIFEPEARHLVTATLVLSGIAVFYFKTAAEDRRVPWGIRDPGREVWSIMRQVRIALPEIKHGTRIYLYDDTFRDWTPKFIIELVYHDRSVSVWLDRIFRLRPQEIARYDYVFAIEHGKLKRVPPEAVSQPPAGLQ